ncbi:24091_t:CDS:2 [Cetraspora pellucida]|uniref:24091_t:CDS:1 n=1 Tax=Cetraspora pellucida TaxID=1433469 RepID=A0A9N8VZU3_9GLOM|nr:24091_t:CDS:2 [Cetraspora pellucida]
MLPRCYHWYRRAVNEQANISKQNQKLELVQDQSVQTNKN